MTATTDRPSADLRRISRDRLDSMEGPPRAMIASVAPRAVALVIDYVILLAAGAGIYGLIDRSGLGAESAQSLSALLSFGLIVLYFSVLESGSAQATIGKRLLGLKVTDGSGDRITFARGVGRFFGKLLSLIPFGVGFVMAIFTDRHRALHDLLAKTFVLKAR